MNPAFHPDIINFITKILSDEKIKFELDTFPSGCSMIDIWFNDLFFVIQIENESIGISLITDEEPGFDTIPDERFYDFDKFKEMFEKIFVNKN